MGSSHHSWGKRSAAVNRMLRPLLPSRSSGSGDETVRLDVLGGKEGGREGKEQFTNNVVEGGRNARVHHLVV